MWVTGGVPAPSFSLEGGGLVGGSSQPCRTLWGCQGLGGRGEGMEGEQQARERGALPARALGLGVKGRQKRGCACFPF